MAGNSAVNPWTVFATRFTTQWPTVQLAPSDVVCLAQNATVRRRVSRILRHLAPDDIISETRAFYRQGKRRFGRSWRYADLLCVLYAATRLARPRRYLEIGVLGGRSMAIVASTAPTCELVGFDAWIEDYAGLPTSGPGAVRARLRRCGHRGACELVRGRSSDTVPDYVAAHPDARFDLITVDGDHTEPGARHDLENVLPLVAVGGLLVFDDVRHPDHVELQAVWEQTVATRTDFACGGFFDAGFGVAVAIRRCEDLTSPWPCPINIEPSLPVTITTWRSRYAGEIVAGTPQLWLPRATDGCALTVRTPTRLTATFEAYATPGPLRPTPIVLWVSCGSCRTEIPISAPGPVSVPLEFERGANRFELRVSSAPFAPAAVAGETRDTALCLGNPRLGSRKPS
jgi:predicted O-methyltransferase YrrM